MHDKEVLHAFSVLFSVIMARFVKEFQWPCCLLLSFFLNMALNFGFRSARAAPSGMWHIVKAHGKLQKQAPFLAQGELCGRKVSHLILEIIANLCAVQSLKYLDTLLIKLKSWLNVEQTWYLTACIVVRVGMVDGWVWAYVWPRELFQWASDYSRALLYSDGGANGLRAKRVLYGCWNWSPKVKHY